jgi:NAD(P)-dependent dehydrogenase (short-subunit alcohol dehydrogenase family)
MNSARGTALITGASSGIGLATAAALADDGWHVVATARNPSVADALGELAAERPNVQLRELDVTNTASVSGCVDAVLAERGAVDLLVNNAGAGHRGTLEQLGDDEFEKCFAVNFYGVARVTRAIIPGMRAHSAGRIITVTSMNGVVAMPFSDAYNAAKFAVEGLMEGLAPVLRNFGIDVSVIEPGPVRTSFLRNAGGRISEVAADDPYAGLLTRYNATMAGLLNSGESAGDVAAVIVGIARDPKPHLRYQSSPNATAIASRKVMDPTGDSVVAATSAFLLGGAATAAGVRP